ncbi:MAG: tryptophan 7-halogenase [Verrucomicrobia bacterium]|nr:tryptophan 7-halogenase [Verrucomicrobiota bacterium]
MTQNYDAIIIGAGPAGTSSAAILAEYGHRVLVLEREKFPLYFFNRYDRETIAQTWQVLRSEFDQMLLDNARSKGATVKEEITVKELLRENGRVIGVRAQHKDGSVVEYRAPITLDCTGKEAFTAVRNGWRMKDPYLNKVAVWTYYKGSKREPGIDEGQTGVAYVPEKGWFWHIPQHNDMVSVGVVAEGRYLTRGGVKEPKDIFHREVEQNIWIKEHLSTGQQVGPYYLISEYSHHARHCGSDGLLLVGDAFAFLDPVFSSGVMLALKSGTMAGEEVHKAIQEGNFSSARFANYASYMRQGVENMRKLVYAFYDPKFSFKKVIDKYPEAAGEITDCLSGDVNKDFEPLWRKIREFVPLPDDLPLGEPLTN